MNFKDRLDLYLEGGMINKKDVVDIENVCQMFLDEYYVELNEENAGMFIAHLCAAYSRLKNDEEVENLPKEVIDELTTLDTYEKSLEVLDKVMKATINPLNNIEQGYVLLHINNLIATLKNLNQWHV